jgi:hypothetical protein
MPMEDALGSPTLPPLVDSERTRLHLPSRPDWIETTADYLCQKAILCGACLEAHGSKLMMAFLEALSNSIVHGNLGVPSVLKEQGDDVFARALAARAADPMYSSRTVEVLIEYDGEECRWEFTDEGEGFDVDAVLRRLENPDPETMLASGRGLIMMKAFLDDVRYELGGRRCILTLERKSPREKRERPRVPVQSPVRVAPVHENGFIDWDTAHEAVTRNLSQGGIAILQSRLATTDRVLIAVTVGGETLYIPAQVRHVRAVGEREVELGCRFQPLPSQMHSEPDKAPYRSVEGAIDSLWAHVKAVQESSDDRRSHPRFTYTERVEVIDPATGTRNHGFARDLSRGGIAFISPTPIPLELRILSLPQGPGRPPMRVRAQVLRCNRVMDEFHDVGARFLSLEA